MSHSADVWVAAAAEGLATAIEELRATEEELRVARDQAEQDRERYQDLFQFAPDGYLVTDPHGKIIEANEAASTMLNLRHDYLMLKPMVVYVVREDQPAFYDAIVSLRREQQD